MVDDDDGDGFCGYYAYDGNGNVGQVLDADDLSTDAHYEYDPYGREIVATGTYAEDNPWRFSTKWLDVIDPDDDASLLYFGYRYLSPRLGRWTSKDPLGDEAFRSVSKNIAPALDHARMSLGDPVETPYGFTRNAPLVHVDLLGLAYADEIVKRLKAFAMAKGFRNMANFYAQECKNRDDPCFESSFPANWRAACENCADYECYVKSSNWSQHRNCITQKYVFCN